MDRRRRPVLRRGRGGAHAWGGDDKASAAKSQPASKEAVDPVCTMKVDPKTAEKSVYKGKTYYFCSKEDKAEFDKSPDKYAKK